MSIGRALRRPRGISINLAAVALSLASAAYGLDAQAAGCNQPLPAETRNLSFTSPVAQDIDPLVDPAPTTEIYLTALLPERCPGDRFPLVIFAHGYGDSRITSMASSGDVDSDDLGLSIYSRTAKALPYHGYVVISYDARGHGESQPPNGGGYVRMNAPEFEVADARALLDWVYDHADALAVQRESSDIAKDLRVGTMGISYGGALQLALAALDPRVDTLVPTVTWHNLLYSLMGGDALKLSWMQSLCAFGAIPSNGAPRIGAVNTPAIRSMCNQVEVQPPASFMLRSRADLMAALAQPETEPRPVSEDELLGLFDAGMRYFQSQQDSGAPWGYGESEARLRAVPTLVVQGNRDGLFNLTEGYLNWRYFNEAGGDVRLMSMDTGHLTPVEGQVDGSGNCGGQKAFDTLLAWFDAKLKGNANSGVQRIADVCLSVQSTVGAPLSPELAVQLSDVPVGSLAGNGALTVIGDVDVTVDARDGRPLFVPLLRVPSDDYVIAGIPTAAAVSVLSQPGAVHEAVGIVGIGIVRDGRVILVDDQVSGFIEGSWSNAGGHPQRDPVLLAGVGEVLRRGDQVGVLIYEQQNQYTTIVSPSALTTLIPGGVASYLGEVPYPHPLSAVLTPLANAATNPNPYRIVIDDLALPVFKPGVWADSRWSYGRIRLDKD